MPSAIHPRVPLKSTLLVVLLGSSSAPRTTFLEPRAAAPHRKRSLVSARRTPSCVRLHPTSSRRSLPSPSSLRRERKSSTRPRRRHLG
ncbi:hypothetical protein GUJ93_ZPchr0007g3414 [Zizania palustris]|uniref:Secreted protein n=1 Tax=Zizania palustris TaxID=103762 RepID=A0A8J5TIP2_ZIZPA|nr:hypothetical protein GUJ93_ZPchr0007g3414 [Zizania palustris]